VAKVSGTATRADGTPHANANVDLAQRIMGPSGGAIGSVGDTRTMADGSWTLRDVPPGDYELSIEGSAERTVIPLNVSGVDLDGVALVTGASGTIGGKIATSDGGGLPPGAGGVRVVARHVAPDGPETLVVTGDDNGLAGRDGTFAIKNVPPGPAVLQVMGLPREWAVRKIEIGGQDHTVRPLQVQNAQQLSNVHIVVTNRLPTVTGRIVNEDQQPADGSALLFPLDSATWLEAAGTLRAARPDQTGTFRFDNVLPGPYYVIALETVQDWQLNDPEFFGELRERATKLTIGEEPPEPVVLKLSKDTK
jgi:hypothetical protein